MKEAGIILICYILGAVPFSYIFGRLFGRVDITTRGSGNVGATNVLRTTSIPVAIMALLGDAGKGFAGAWFGTMAGGDLIGAILLGAICGAVVVLGHCYSVFLNFKGGKGVATAAGVLLAFMPDIVAVLVVVFLVLVVFTRYVSLGSISVAAALPFLSMVYLKPWPYVTMCFLISTIVIYRHRENIERLKKGTESRITEKAT